MFQVGVGAKSLSLGKAQVAAVGDAASIFNNPAALSEIKKVSFTTMAGTLMQDVPYQVFGIANPFWFGTVGVGYIGASMGSIRLTTMRGPTPEVVGSTNYGSSALVFSYAKEINNHLSFGTNLKMLSQGASITSASLEGASGAGWTMDFALKYKALPWCFLGLNAQNVFGSKFSWQRNGVQETIPIMVKAGTQLCLVGKEAPYLWSEQSLYLNLDADYNASYNRPLLWHTGLEWWPMYLLALRIGFDQQYKAEGSGFGATSNLTAGVGVYLKGFSFDYAYHSYNGLAENSAHFFSIGFAVRKLFEPTEKAEQIKTAVSYFSPIIKAKPALENFTDVPDDFWASDAIAYVSTLGIMQGYPDHFFKPDAPIDRAEMAAILVNAKKFELDKVEIRPLFDDLPVDNWAAAPVQIAVEHGYMSGYPDGKFRPAQKLKRDEAVVILAKFAGLIEPKRIESPPFPDVPTEHWAAKWIYAAKISGLLEYLAGQDFNPEEDFSRAEAAEILSKTHFGKTEIKRFLQGL
ncbi:MAG: PorV/PorQ family protein [Candidatus Saganbacteria bacterium]|nr:PorV/PorQ family protein [Candidatus Saganbacteria bacterium]